MMQHFSLNRRHLWHWALVSAVDFLGLLHLEIIQERLEREYNLDLVTTAPGVIYKVHKTNGETVMDLTNPSNLPDPSEIDYMEEPMVSAEIMVTTEYIGAIMDLCQERRGIYIRYGIYGGDTCADQI